MMLNQITNHHRTDRVNWREELENARQARLKRFADLKMTAIQQVGHQLMTGLELMQHAHACGNERFALVELPHEVFSWSISDCIKRRQYTLAWHKLLLKQYGGSCLRKRKIIADFEELKKYAKLAIDWHSQRSLDFDIVECLRSIQHYIDYEQILTAERDASWSIMLGALHKRAAMQVAEPIAKARMRLKLDDMKVNYKRNTRLRYAKKFTATDVQQAEDKDQTQCDAAQKQIDRYLKRMENERFCSTCCINYYYSEIQSLKERINEVNTKYDVDFEKVTNDVNYAKLTIDKMGAQRTLLTEEMQRFREEIARIRAQEANEAELERLAEIERVMQRKSIKVPKGKKRSNKQPAVPQPPQPKAAKVQKPDEPESIKAMLKGVMKIKSTKVPKNLNVKNYV